MKQGKPLITFVIVLLAAALGCYILYSVWRTFEDPFTTTYAYEYELNDSVETEGLIVRLPVSRDARLKRVMVTPKAEALNQQAAIRIQHVEAALTRGLTQAELDQFMATVEKLKHNLTELSNPRPEAERSADSPHANS